MLIVFADEPIRNDEGKQSRATAVHRLGSLERQLWARCVPKAEHGNRLCKVYFLRKTNVGAGRSECTLPPGPAAQAARGAPDRPTGGRFRQPRAPSPPPRRSPTINRDTPLSRCPSSVGRSPPVAAQNDSPKSPASRAPTRPQARQNPHCRVTVVIPTCHRCRDFRPPDSPRQIAPNPAILPQSNRWTQPRSCGHIAP